MEKAILISGEYIRFKATGGMFYRYKAQFGRELLDDLEKAAEGVAELDTLYNIIWTLAKTADDSIPPPDAWLDSFEIFPVLDIYHELQDIILGNIKVDACNRALGDSDEGDRMSTEDFVALLSMLGVSIADMDRFTYGMLINLTHSHTRLKMQMAGKQVANADEQYKQLKNIEPLIDERYKKGEIGQKEYLNFKAQIENYERGQ